MADNDIQRIRQQLQEHLQSHETAGQFLKSFVYGGLDGAVSGFAVVATAFGANYSVLELVGIGLASMMVEGLSMAMSDYFSTKAEEQFAMLELQREKKQIDVDPETQVQEMKTIYTQKGLDLESANKIASTLRNYRDPWADVMLIQQLGLKVEDTSSAVNNAIVTFLAFSALRTLPFLPFIAALIFLTPQSQLNLFKALFYVSLMITLWAMFMLGVIKSKFSVMIWYLSGLQSLSIGSLSAVIGFGIGLMFEE